MFLGKGRENEIRLRYGKESAVCLRAFAAPKASGTDGNFGLLNLIPRALGVEFGIDKTGQALLLVRLENVDAGYKKDRTDRYDGEQAYYEALLPLQTAE